jgi:4a-hydroxytetrahydrobiopterin dehydratase
MPTKLTPADIQKKMAHLEGWTVEDGKLFKEVVLPDFARAFGLMSSIAVVAEGLGHHPEWYNVYNKVRFWLTTHDVGGISDEDFTLAKKIDDLLD